MKEIQIPQQVGWILAELEKNGYEAYAVCLLYTSVVRLRDLFVH